MAILSGVLASGPPASLVIDRTPGLTDSEAASHPGDFCRIGNIVYFRANDGANNTELWRSDGTEAGTRKVFEINPRGSVVGEATGSDPQDLFDFNGTLYFTAYTDTEGRELRKSDGTAQGTVLVRDIQPGPESGILSSGPDFTVYHNQLYFVGAASGKSGLLFRTDGTAQGTVALGVGPDPANPLFRGMTEIETSRGIPFFESARRR